MPNNRVGIFMEYAMNSHNEYGLVQFSEKTYLGGIHPSFSVASYNTVLKESMINILWNIFLFFNEIQLKEETYSLNHKLWLCLSKSREETVHLKYLNQSREQTCSCFSSLYQFPFHFGKTKHFVLPRMFSNNKFYL